MRRLSPEQAAAAHRDPADRLVTLVEAARIVGRPVETVRSWVRVGRLPALRDHRGRVWVTWAMLATAERDARSTGRGRPRRRVSLDEPSTGT